MEWTYEKYHEGKVLSIKTVERAWGNLNEVY
jgi:hypothetical protein